MAEMVLTNAYVMINTVELSDHVKSLTLNYSAELHDNTVMGDSARSRLAGLKDIALDVEFLHDFALTEIDATIFSLVGAAEFAVKIRAVNAAISTTNPEYQFNAVIESYPVITGAVGDLHTTTVRFLGTTVITRDVTP